MVYSQKYCLVSFVNEVKDGVQFHMDNWPPHITVADVFAINHVDKDFLQRFDELCANFESFVVGIAEKSMLGTTPVFLLDESTQLQRLHESTISLLERKGATFNNPEFTRSGFVPHSTIQKVQVLQKEDPITVDSVSLVDMFPGADWQQRRVLATFWLKT